MSGSCGVAGAESGGVAVPDMSDWNGDESTRLSGICRSEQSETSDRGGLSIGPGPVVKRGHARMAIFSSGSVIRLAASGSNTRCRIAFSPCDSGNIVLKNCRSFRYARYVLSVGAARFHGFRPQVRFTRITPRDQTSFGRDA